jgi:hypothetical protein
MEWRPGVRERLDHNVTCLVLDCVKAARVDLVIDINLPDGFEPTDGAGSIWMASPVGMTGCGLQASKGLLASDTSGLLTAKIRVVADAGWHWRAGVMWCLLPC